MLQIIIVYVLARNIGNKVAAKGHRRFGYQLMLVALWVAGELVGGVIGMVLYQAMTLRDLGDEQPGFPWLGYDGALAGAVIGALIAFVVANSLAPVQDDEDFYEIDERRRDDEVRRAWRAAEDKPLPDGDHIQGRPASRREDDRIQE